MGPLLMNKWVHSGVLRGARMTGAWRERGAIRRDRGETDRQTCDSML